MPAWLIPALKAVLPHVGKIIAAAKPVFTTKDADHDAAPMLLQQQISELQAAALRNAENTRDLAGHLESTVRALEQAAAVANARLVRACALSVAALLVSLATALFVVLAR
ncbi:MAG: hypothetical protein HYS20_01460 [Rhodocyclales bacterium]|nr:hypothetical protein [Rhodocyclales bacterium]